MRGELLGAWRRSFGLLVADARSQSRSRYAFVGIIVALLVAPFAVLFGQLVRSHLLATSDISILELRHARGRRPLYAACRAVLALWLEPSRPVAVLRSRGSVSRVRLVGSRALHRRCRDQRDGGGGLPLGVLASWASRGAHAGSGRHRDTCPRAGRQSVAVSVESLCDCDAVVRGGVAGVVRSLWRPLAVTGGGRARVLYSAGARRRSRRSRCAARRRRVGARH